MPLLQIESRVLGDINTFADQVVPQCEVECIDDVVAVGSDEVKESLCVRWRVELLSPLSVEFLVDLLQDVETCPTEPVLSQILDCSLTSADVLNDYPVQIASCSCRDGGVKLLLNGAKVP